MQIGGNKSMSEFLSSYDLMSEPMDVRYQTKAAEYYRKKLRAFANDQEFTEEMPDYEDGRMPIEYKVKSQEEIKEAVGAGGIYGGDEPENPNVEKAKEILGELWNGTKKVTTQGLNLASQGVKKVGNKMDESGVTDKVKSGAQTVGKKTVEIGGIAYNKTKEGIVKIASNEKVQEYSSKAYNGAKEAGKSIWGFFSNALNGDENNNGGGSQASGSENAPPAAPQ